MTSVIVIGDGGREAAIAQALQQVTSTARTSVDALSGMMPPGQKGLNPLFVIGPEVPLVAGLADELRANGALVLGPNADGANLEGSKAFMKEVLDAAGVPTARWRYVTSWKEALDALDVIGVPCAIKTEGLAAGKGVTMAYTLEAARADIRAKLSGTMFGAAGKRLVIEECLVGPELSVTALCDGYRAVLLPAARDHKRLLDGDEGPNTGGMGAFSPVPDAPDEAVLFEIVERVLHTLRTVYVVDYRGVMYVGLMLTADGPKVLEINVRFGDPEAQVIMPRVEPESLLRCMIEAAQGKLTSTPTILSKMAVTVTMAAAGYPGRPRAGDVITGVGAAERLPGVSVQLAGVEELMGHLETRGGRVLYVTGVGKTLLEAQQRAYAGAHCIDFNGRQLRGDIAVSAMVRL